MKFVSASLMSNKKIDSHIFLKSHRNKFTLLHNVCLPVGKILFKFNKKEARPCV